MITSFTRTAAVLAALFFWTNALFAVDWHEPQSIATTALEQSPSLGGLDAEVRAARDRQTTAGSLPNPMVMGGVANQQIDLTIDEQMTMYWVGASQTLTRGSRRKALRRRAGTEVERLQLQAESLRAEVERDALFAYYAVAAADSQIAAARRVRAMAALTSRAAKVRYEVGTAVQADLIRAELALADLDHVILTRQGQRNAAVARLLPLLGLPLTTEIPPLHLAHETAGRSLSGDIAVPDSHPALAAVLLEVQSLDQDVRLARLAYKPDWNIEASYAARPYQKDMFSITGRIELPYRRKTLLDPTIRAARAEQDAARYRIEIVRRRILQDLAVAAAAHEQATAQLELHENKLVPMAKLGFESALGAYQSGKENFESVLNAAGTSLRLEIDYYDFLLRHIQAITDFAALRKGARSGALSGGGAEMGSGPGSGSSAAPPTGSDPMGGGR